MPRIHHLDAGTLRPVLGASITPSGVLACRVIVIELDDDRLALIDTGIGAAARLHPRRHLGAGAAAALKADRDPGGNRRRAARRARPRSGARDRHPHHAPRHGSRRRPRRLPGSDGAPAPQGAGGRAEPLPTERPRYRKANWSHAVRWEPFGEGGARRASSTALRHTPTCCQAAASSRSAARAFPAAHTGYAIPLDGDGGWLVHAGDCFYVAGQIAPDDHGLPVGWGVAPVRVLRGGHAWKIRGNHRMLRELAAHEDVTVVCFARRHADRAPRHRLSPAPRSWAVLPVDGTARRPTLRARDRGPYCRWMAPARRPTISGRWRGSVPGARRARGRRMRRRRAAPRAWRGAARRRGA